MCLPKDLFTILTAYGDPSFAANLTPTDIIVDLHIDQGRDGLIQCIRSCKKIVLMWPAQNLNVLLHQSNCQAKFIHAAHQLQWGIITIIDSNVGLAMFADTLHATITQEPSFLVGINWVSVENHRSAVRCFEYEIHSGMESNIKSIFTIYADQLNASLDGNDTARHQQVLDDLVHIIYPILQDRRDVNKLWVELADEHIAFDNFFTRTGKSLLSCYGCDPRNIE